LSFASHCCTGLIAAVAACLRLQAQAPASAEPAYFERITQVPAPESFSHALNASLTVSGMHDSSIGRYNIATPAVSYSFSPRYALDASMSIYPYRMVADTAEPPAPPGPPIPATGDLGDLYVRLNWSKDCKIGRSDLSMTCLMLDTKETAKINPIEERPCFGCLGR
jgi:hypothetical protein